jgi:hypothetical protein
VTKFQNDLRNLGGIAKRGELLALDHSRDYIDLLDYYRSIIRVRKGWYAAKDAPAAALRAWRAGGRLACVSAARFHGLDLAGIDDTMHISVPRNSSRHRIAETTKAARRSMIVHWTDPLPFQQLGAVERRAQPLDDAIAQMLRCPHAARFFVAVTKQGLTSGQRTENSRAPDTL